MVAGLGTTFYYMVMTQPWLRGIFGVTSPVQLWWDIQPISAGLFGVAAGSAAIVVVSLMPRVLPWLTRTVIARLTRTKSH
jgi:cation/acetate symporter